MSSANPGPFESEPLIPAGLREALRARERVEFTVPAEVDAAIRGAARRHLGRRRRVLRIWVPVTGAAAAILLLALLLPFRPALRAKSPAPAGADAAIVAAPGREERVTILSAFALARRLDAGESPGLEWDYNADRVVDQRDVESLALAAVKLEGRT